jgi:hypothetical protein
MADQKRGPTLGQRDLSPRLEQLFTAGLALLDSGQGLAVGNRRGVEPRQLPRSEVQLVADLPVKFPQSPTNLCTWSVMKPMLRSM